MTEFRLRPADIVRWMAALVTLALAAALCLSCLELYRAGTAPENLTAEGVRINDIYTRENVGEKLAKLAPAAISWVILLILSAMQPKEPEKRLPLDPENALRLLRPRVEETPAMRRHQRARRLFCIGTGLLLTGAVAYIARYMTDVRHFTSWDLEMVMGDMVRALALPMSGIVLGLCVAAVWLEHSYAAEWNAAKQAPKRPNAAEKPAPRKDFPVGAVRIGIAAAALALIVAGILNGGMYDVLVKAINICTECIGLG